MVIRSDYVGPLEAPGDNERHVVPPKAGELTAEHHGMFDTPPGTVPSVDVAKYALIADREAKTLIDAGGVVDGRACELLPAGRPAGGAVPAGSDGVRGLVPEPSRTDGSVRFYRFDPAAGEDWPDLQPFRIRLTQSGNDGKNPAAEPFLTASDRVLHLELPKAHVVTLGSRLRPFPSRSRGSACGSGLRRPSPRQLRRAAEGRRHWGALADVARPCAHVGPRRSPTARDAGVEEPARRPRPRPDLRDDRRPEGSSSAARAPARLRCSATGRSASTTAPARPPRRRSRSTTSPSSSPSYATRRSRPTSASTGCSSRTGTSSATRSSAKTTYRAVATTKFGEYFLKRGAALRRRPERLDPAQRRRRGRDPGDVQLRHRPSPVYTLGTDYAVKPDGIIELKGRFRPARSSRSRISHRRSRGRPRRRRR